MQPMSKKIVWIVCVSLLGCGERPAEPQKAEAKVRPHVGAVVGEFRSKVYPLSDHERVMIMDVPTRYEPNRCWIYVNEKIGTSHMRCESDGVTDSLPLQGPELER